MLVDMARRNEDYVVKSIKDAAELLNASYKNGTVDEGVIEEQELWLRQALFVHGTVVDGKVTDEAAKNKVNECGDIPVETKEYVLGNPVEPVHCVRDRLSEITLIPGRRPTVLFWFSKEEAKNGTRLEWEKKFEAERAKAGIEDITQEPVVCLFLP